MMFDPDKCVSQVPHFEYFTGCHQVFPVGDYEVSVIQEEIANGRVYQ